MYENSKRTIGWNAGWYQLREVVSENGPGSVSTRVSVGKPQKLLETYLHDYSFYLVVTHILQKSARLHRALLKLNRTRRLARVVVADTAHPVNLVDDACGDLGQKLGVKGVRNGCHEVPGLDRAQEHNVLVHTLVAHDAHGSAGVKGREGLADLVVQAGLPNHADEDVVRLPCHLDALRGGLAEDPDCDAL